VATVYEWLDEQVEDSRSDARLLLEEAQQLSSAAPRDVADVDTMDVSADAGPQSEEEEVESDLEEYDSRVSAVAIRYLIADNGVAKAQLRLDLEEAKEEVRLMKEELKELKGTAGRLRRHLARAEIEEARRA